MKRVQPAADSQRISPPWARTMERAPDPQVPKGLDPHEKDALAAQDDELAGGLA